MEKSTPAKANKKTISSFTTLLVIVNIFVVTISVILGLILTSSSVGRMKEMVSYKSLELAITAAAMLDGDSLKDLQEEDIGSPEYNKAFDTLKKFKNSNEGTSGELAYIYCCREIGDGKYEFVIDPADDPALFGEELEWTAALESASQGKAAFDDAPFTDRWGTFYSAYAPVFDSSKQVAMIVGVDIWADWFNTTIYQNTIFIVVISATATLSSVVLGFVLNHQVRRRFQVLTEEYNLLEESINVLISDFKESLSQDNSYTASLPTVEAGDQVTELTGKIRSTQNTIKKYLLATEKRAYIDSLSQVGNRGAYMEKMEEVGLSQPFTIMALDIDYLKKVNDTFGHNYGDQYIQKIAEILKKTCLEQGIDLGDGYHHHTIFRIGGDEFAIITQEMSEEQRQQFKDSLNANLDAFNQQKKLPFPLSVSIGCANFDPKEDHSFLDAYEKADKEMYIQKKARHSTNPFDLD